MVNQLISMYKRVPYHVFDLSIASANFVADFNWRTMDDWHASDHAPIVISNDYIAHLQGSERWLIKKADWKKFEELSKIRGQSRRISDRG